MWYPSPTQDQHERVLPDEMVDAVEPDLRTTVGACVESSEKGVAAKALVRSKVKVALAGPGSEYWLP